MACAGGLPLLAMAVVVLYFVALYGFPLLGRFVPPLAQGASTLQVSYHDSRGVLRDLLEACTTQGFGVSQLETAERTRPGIVSVLLVVQGRGSAAQLAANLQEIDGVVSVTAEDSSAD
jgi:putative Mg2+ transporter-C (MgtC) family protein